jgi:two-component system, NtrC family, response regulator HydG
MTGSHPLRPRSPHDPILTARLEAIGQLAGDLSERVAVMDRDYNVVYANEAARHDQQAGSPRHHRKCYQLFANRMDPCKMCPAIETFGPADQHVSSSRDLRATECAMHQAFPLKAAGGEVASVLVVFKPLAQTTALAETTVPEENILPMVREHLGDLIGRSAPMQELFDTITLVADSSASVLIQGESGTGKELVAKTIHRLSGRRDMPFVVVDCSSVPETLLESELFGHVKGAFTGAVANKPGLFEEADGGTIFLDEIADTTASFQAKLLRVLQEGEVKRVGGNKPVKVDARVISATNKDLAELVTNKQFRQDLYYRLAVLPLQLPPLRDRKDDIPLLIKRFVAQSCARHRQAVRQVSGDTLHALSAASWPGNVRELQHFIERAIVTTAGPYVTCKDMTIGSQDGTHGLRSAAREAASHTERARILSALKQTNGNRAKAAKLLEISRASLYNKLHAYKLVNAAVKSVHTRAVSHCAS